MRVENKLAADMSEGALKAKTGKGWQEWFKALDDLGGPEKGRRAFNEYLMSQPGMDAWWTTTIVNEYETARGVVEKDGRPKGYSICVTKSIGAPVAKVFGAFADAAERDKWFGGGNQNDFKAGGRFSNADGNAGEYKKVRENKDMKFTWENAGQTPGGTVEILFAAKGDSKTGITLNHERIAKREEADGLREAWGSALDQLKAYAEKK